MNRLGATEMKRLKQVWYNMLYRCKGNTATSKNYYDRGIRVCDEWMNFDAFYSWAADKYRPGLTIERINNDGNYCPDNCRFSTWDEQARNRRPARARIDRSSGSLINPWSFYRGYLNIMIKDQAEVVREIKDALKITSSTAFYFRLHGDWEPKISEYLAIEAIFKAHGVTEIWGHS